MWSRTVATTTAVIALIAASCGSGAGVDTTGTVPSRPEAIATESLEGDIAPRAEPIPSAAETETETDTAPTAPAPDPRWARLLADARSSMIAGHCDQAIGLFDELLAR